MNERWSTEQAMRAGVLNRGAPVKLCPPGAVLAEANEETNPDTFEALLEAGGIDCSEYYGCWYIWKKEDGAFGGQLLQYRITTDQFDGLSLQDAVARARGWHALCWG